MGNGAIFSLNYIRREEIKIRSRKILKINQGTSQIQIEVLLALCGCPHPLSPPPLNLLTAFPPP